MKMMLRKTVALILAILMVMGIFPVYQAQEAVAASGTTVFFKPNSNWTQSGARFAVYYWTSSSNNWVSMTEVGPGVYWAEIPTCDNFKFVRLNGSTTANNWDNKWNEWSNMAIGDVSSSNNCYTQNSGWDNGSGSWGTFAMHVSGSTSLTGYNWDNSQNSMTMISAGVYQITFKNVAAGNHEFKVNDGTWNNSWGKDGGESNYTFSTTGTNDVTITFTYSSKTIDVSVVSTVKTYNVTFNGTNVTSNGAATASSDVAYTATLTAATGFDLPNTIEVKVGGSAITGYTYDSATGALSIPASKITGDIVITASGVGQSYDVSFALNNISKVSGEATCNFGAAYTATLQADTGYVLPASVTVKVGGTTLTSGYTYENGVVTIEAAYVTGAIEIIASTTELAKYDVAYTLVGVINQNGEDVCTHGQVFTATLTLADGYTTPVAIEVVAGGKILTEGTDYTYDNVTGQFTIMGSAVTGDIVIKATGTAETYNVTYNLTNITASGADACSYNTAYTATLSATSGYELPGQITVTVGGNTLTEGYSYNSSTGVVSIDAAYVTGAIEITAAAETIKCDVTFNGSYVTSTGAAEIDYNVAYTATLKVDSGLKLPSSITVTVGGTTLTSGADYTYNSTTGELTINAAAVTGDIVINAAATRYLYLDPNMWVVDGGPYAIHYWNSSTSGDVTMTEGDNGIYYAEVPADATNVLFHRNNYGHKTNDLTVPTDGSNLYTITGWDSGNKICPGTWSTYGGSSSVESDTFYVNTDIVDYLNDYRVNSGAVNDYSNDNQGIWMDKADNPVFTYLNYVISQNAKNSDGTVNYTYPLYFGNMLFISNRYGTTYQSFTDYNGYDNFRKNNKQTLNNWNTAANVALYYNNGYNAVVQGLVGKQLDQYGQLVDPVTGKQLFYFDKTSIESWTTSGSNGKRLMAYYSNLQFPFSTTYDPDTRVTTYSYNSASDDAVFIDYDNYNASSSSNPMITDSNYAKDQYNNKGFFPLNKPGDYENESNYGFGVKFTIDFTVSKNGTIVSADGSETPVKFTFTGDDDVWVFIDGHLVLDMGGAHTMATGTIDFKNLNASVEQAAQIGGQYYNPSFYNDQYGYDGDGEQRETGLSVELQKPAAFPTELAAAFQNEYNTGVSQVHTLTMFYMERGGIESNMSIEFSMSPIPTGLTVSKDIDNVNPGLNDDVQDDDEFSFTVDATDSDGNKVTFDGYDLTDHGSVTTEGVVNGNVISGIRGDRYAHNFTYGSFDAFTAGTSFTVTEGSYDTSKYSGTRWAVYEYSNGYTKVAEGTGVTAAFEMLANSSGNYALNFINSLNTGSLTLSKTYMDTLIDSSDMEFVFEIYLDVDGEGYNLHPGLTYDLYNGSTLVSQDNISADGKITMKAGQTVKINGIPVGTKYKVVESDDSALWEVVGSSEATGTMTTAGAELSFTNKTTSTDLDKVIYVQAGKDTPYAIADGTKSITLNSVSSNNANLSVAISDNKVMVNGGEADQVYTFEYAGTYPDGSYVSGTVTVYTYAATVRNYVFDFGLSADLEDTTYGNGLFQDAVFDNFYVSGEVAKLISLSGSGNTQTTITTTLGNTFDANNGYDEVIFTPVAFMSQIETYTYEVQITALGKPFDANNPETGCIVTGTIRVMPANTVYYEDSFNTSGDSEGEKIIFSDGVTQETPDKELTQTNGITGPYGYDSAYNGYYQNSNGSAAILTSDVTFTQAGEAVNNSDYAYFTFTGTGFDLISQTNATSGGMAVYVFKGAHSEAYLEYVTDLTNTSVTPEDMVFVNNYYCNGSLYQVPVVNVRLGAQDTYTVYVQALQTSIGKSVALDGVRIYNPLSDTQYYSEAEKTVVFSELRQLFNSARGDGKDEVNDSNDILHLAGLSEDGLYTGLGKKSVVMESLIENPELNADISTAEDVMSIYKHGPNNEMYLPKNFGVMFTYSVTGSNWTMQLGAKAVRAKGEAKSISVYARVKDADSYEMVAEITLSTGTDMYYDLTQYLGGYSAQGQEYDLFIISNSAAGNNEFVSLTSVKHAGVTLGES